MDFVRDVQLSSCLDGLCFVVLAKLSSAYREWFWNIINLKMDLLVVITGAELIWIEWDFRKSIEFDCALQFGTMSRRRSNGFIEMW